MSSRRSRTSRITEDEINKLILKLQAAISETPRTGTTRATTSKIVRETCNYILQRQVEDLSERLSLLMASTDTNSTEATNFRATVMMQH